MVTISIQNLVLKPIVDRISGKKTSFSKDRTSEYMHNFDMLGKYPFQPFYRLTIIDMTFTQHKPIISHFFHCGLVFTPVWSPVVLSLLCAPTPQRLVETTNGVNTRPRPKNEKCLGYAFFLVCASCGYDLKMTDNVGIFLKENVR